MKSFTTVLTLSFLAAMTLAANPITRHSVTGLSNPDLNSLMYQINGRGMVEVYSDKVVFFGYCNTCTASRANGNFACTEMWCGKEANQLETFVVRVLSEDGLSFIDEHANDNEFKVNGKKDWVKLQSLDFM